MAEISADITLFHILPKLPVKSLRRFQCVSKQWLSFISTPEFAKMQLHHITTNQLQDDQNHHKFLALSIPKPYNFRIIECEKCKQNSLTTCSRPLPFKVGDIHYRSILACFHGMVCVGVVNTRLDGYSVLILWKPSMGEYKTLSKPADSHEECYYNIYGGLFGLYYSSCDDDYKLLRITCAPNVYTYSLKFDAWRKIQSTHTFRPIHHYFSYDAKSSGVLLNEKLYFLEQLNTGNYSIIRFDTMTAKFTEIATPVSQNTKPDCLSFMVLRGCIHLIATNERCDDQLWRLDEDEDGGWTKVETILGFSPGQKPLHWMSNGKWLVRSYYGNVYQVNLKKQNRRSRLCLLRRRGESRT